MRVLNVSNVHMALPLGVQELFTRGVQRESRNGPVLVYPTPVTTVYQKPLERVVFWPERDANPFFHLYESLWMLAGRNDVEGVARYAKQMREYSDDGVELHGAYGYRWRNGRWIARQGDPDNDQLKTIAGALKKDSGDRRCVLQMWDAVLDLGRDGKDVPCNTTATFQVADGKLNMVVFCRSNDIVWGAYGANAVHFGFLLEYMALAAGYEVGTYTQVSVNYHGYLSTLEPLREFTRRQMNRLFSVAESIGNPYEDNELEPLRLGAEKGTERLDLEIQYVLGNADHEFIWPTVEFDSGGLYTIHEILRAHHLWRTLPPPERFDRAWAVLQELNPSIDFVVAAAEWIERRRARWEAKMEHGSAHQA